MCLAVYIVLCRTTYDGNQNQKISNLHDILSQKNKGRTFNGTSRAIELNFIFFYSEPLSFPFYKCMPYMHMYTFIGRVFRIDFICFGYPFSILFYFLKNAVSITPTLCK